MNVVIVILVKNGVAFLSKSLVSIHQQQGAFCLLEVIAIDSGSSDGSLELLHQYPVRVVEIPSSTFNHGETRNLGVRLAGDRADCVVFLSQDAVPADENWLEYLVRPFAEDPMVAGVFSRHIPRSESTPAMVRQLTTVWQTGGAERLVKQLPASPEVYERDKSYYTYFSNTSSAIRKSVWKDIPLHQLSFAEDADWADRALRAGYKIIFEPRSKVVHSHDYSLFEQFRQNVDHSAGMKRLFPATVYCSFRDWLRLFLGVPLEAYKDWKFVQLSEHFVGASSLQKLIWFIHSMLWHEASALGTWTGIHLERFPKKMRLFFSRQERIRQCL